MDFFHPFRQKLIKMTFNLIDKHANEGNNLFYVNAYLEQLHWFIHRPVTVNFINVNKRKFYCC